MGSFNVSGGISNLSISGKTPVVLIPLIPKNYRYNRTGVVRIEPTVSFFSGEFSFYDPAFLPIYGEYSEYGDIENIKRDANVEFIESFFDITIEKFIQTICSYKETIQDPDDFDEKELLLLSLSGMFEIASVYQDMVAYSHSQNIAYNESDNTKSLLEFMGFEVNKDINTGDSRYSKRYTHPNFTKYSINSDGTWIKVINERNKEVNESFYQS